MKNFLHIQILIFAILLPLPLCFSQEVRRKTRLPAPPPANESSPSPWKEFSSVEGRFSISMPGKPKEETRQMATEAGPLNIKLYGLQTAVAEYWVGYSDFPLSIESLELRRQVLEAGLEGNQQGGRLLSKKEILIDGYAGRELSVELPSATLRERVYLVENRRYQVLIVFQKEKPDNPNIIEFQESTAKKYLDSFKLIKEKSKAP